jgi:hypothetical protein
MLDRRETNVVSLLYLSIAVNRFIIILSS